MNRRLLIILALLVSPFFIAAAGVSGGGSGCGCPNDGGETAITNTLEGDPTSNPPGEAFKTGDEKEDPSGENSGSKDIFAFMPNVDLIAYAKVNEIITNPVIKALLLKISDSNSLLSQRIQQNTLNIKVETDTAEPNVTAPDFSINDTAGNVIGLKTPDLTSLRGTEQTGLQRLMTGYKITKTLNESIAEGKINMLILGAKYHAPEISAKMSEDKIYLTDILFLAISPDGESEEVKAVFNKTYAERLLQSSEDIGGIIFQAYKGPNVCKIANGLRTCEDMTVYMGAVDKQLVALGSKELLTKFIDGYKFGKIADSVKNNKDLWTTLQGLPSYCSICSAATAPLAASLNKEISSDSDFAKTFSQFWTGENKPQISTVALGIGLASNLSLDFRAHLFDASKPDIFLSMYLSEELWKSFNLEGFALRLTETSKVRNTIDPAVLEQPILQPTIEQNTLQLLK